MRHKDARVPIESAPVLLKRLSRGLGRTKPPKSLYHYTSAEGLLGILATKSIRATSIRYMNDTREFQLALALAEREIDARIPSNGPRYLRGMHSLLLDALRHTHEVDVFVTCFSENGDVLSQWRGYTPAGQGYSIGIASATLMASSGKKAEHQLGACIYDSERAGTLIARIVNAVVRYAERERVHDSAHASRVHRESFHLFSQLLSLAGPRIKDPAFKEEAEWRLIAAATAFEQPGPSFRAGRSTLVPYYLFPFAQDNGRFGVREIIISPTADPKLSSQAVGALLGSHRLSPVTVRSSSAPYRNW